MLFLFPPLQHAEMADESVQLKTLQTILIIYQSHLHPENEVMKVEVKQFHYLQKLDVFVKIVARVHAIYAWNV